jgi:hypothetical protein
MFVQAKFVKEIHEGNYKYRFVCWILNIQETKSCSTTRVPEEGIFPYNSIRMHETHFWIPFFFFPNRRHPLQKMAFSKYFRIPFNWLKIMHRTGHNPSIFLLVTLSVGAWISGRQVPGRTMRWCWRLFIANNSFPVPTDYSFILTSCHSLAKLWTWPSYKPLRSTALQITLLYSCKEVLLLFWCWGLSALQP